MKDTTEDEEEEDENDSWENEDDIPLFLLRQPLRADLKPVQPVPDDPGTKPLNSELLSPGSSYDALGEGSKQSVRKWDYDLNDWGQSEPIDEYEDYSAYYPPTSIIKPSEKIQTNWYKGYDAFEGDKFLNQDAQTMYLLCPFSDPKSMIDWWQGWWSAASWFWREHNKIELDNYKPTASVVCSSMFDWE